MSIPRQALADFAVNNPYYAGATVEVWAVDANLQKTALLAPLYAGPTGATLLGNPQVLDSRGRWPAPVYVDQPVILTVTRDTDIRDTGIVGVVPRWRGEWATAQTYYAGDRVSIPGAVAVAVVTTTHVSGVYAADLAAGRLELETSWSGNGQVLIATRDITVPTNIITPFLNLSAFRSLRLSWVGVSFSAAGRIVLRASGDNGSSFSSGSYTAFRNDATPVTAVGFFLDDSSTMAAAAEAAGWLDIVMQTEAGQNRVFVDGTSLYRESTGAAQEVARYSGVSPLLTGSQFALRVETAGAVNFTAGRFTLTGVPA